MTESLHQIASELYEQAAAAEQAEGSAPGEGGAQPGAEDPQQQKKEGAVDADFEVVEEEKVEEEK